MLLEKHGFPGEIRYRNPNISSMNSPLPLKELRHLWAKDLHLSWSGNHIKIVAQAAKHADFIEDNDRDFYGICSLEGVTATILTCLKDILLHAL